MNREKTKKTKGVRYVQTSRALPPLSPLPRALREPSPATSLPSLTITAGAGRVYVQLRKFALPSISAVAHVGSRANRRTNNEDVCEEKKT